MGLDWLVYLNTRWLRLKFILNYHMNLTNTKSTTKTNNNNKKGKSKITQDLLK
jgi:hypothetical protein